MTNFIIPWIIWTLVLLLVLGATLATGLLSLFLKGTGRARAIDGLLWSATLAYVVGIAAMFLPQQKLSSEKIKEAQEAFQLSYVKRADLSAEGLAVAYNVESLGQPLKGIARSDGVPTWNTELTKTDLWLRSVARSHPTDGAIAARLAIVTHELGADPAKVFQDYDNAGGLPNPLVTSLSNLYCPAHDTDSRQDVTTADETATTIKDGLPKGWYQQMALLTTYKAASPKEMQELTAQREGQVRNWQVRYAVYQAVRAICCVAFLLTLLALPFVWNHTTVTLEDPPDYGFRKAYGCMLSLLYAQFFAGIICGLGVSLAVSFKLGTFNAGSFAVITLTTAILAGIAAAVCSVYFFVCKPGHMSLGTFCKGPVPISLKRLMITGAIGFCSAVGLNYSVRFLANLIPGTPHGSNNIVQLHMSDALATADLGLIIWYALVAVILAPIVEETLFRGLLYPWLRKRAGIIVAVVISSVLFALFHFDAQGAIQYCALGVVLALVYERSRSIPATAFVHALWNVWVLVIMSWLTP